jgi:hypothetical protein
VSALVSGVLLRCPVAGCEQHGDAVTLPEHLRVGHDVDALVRRLMELARAGGRAAQVCGAMPQDSPGAPCHQPPGHFGPRLAVVQVSPGAETYRLFCDADNSTASPAASGAVIR